MADAHYLRKRMRLDSLNVHKDLCAIAVRYHLEAGIIAGEDRILQTESRLAQRLIHIQGLCGETDVDETADQIINSSKLRIHPQLIRLAIYIASEPNAARLICKEKGTESLLGKAMASADPLIMRMSKALSSHEPIIKEQYLPYLESILKIALGILANMTIEGFDFARLLLQADLISLIKDGIMQHALDSLSFECLVLVTSAVVDEDCCKALIRIRIVDDVLSLLRVHQENDSFVVQIVHCFHEMVFKRMLRQHVIDETDAISYIIEMMHDKNVRVRLICERTLPVIAEHSGGWSNEIKSGKYRWHDSEWLAAMEARSAKSPADLAESDYVRYDGVCDAGDFGQHEECTNTMISAMV
eukprot:Clim_evm68s153 gene=Clim_evmTU68s153